MRTLIRLCRLSIVPVLLSLCFLPQSVRAQGGNIDWEELWTVMQPTTPNTPTYGWMAGQRQYTGIACDRFRNVVYVVNPAVVPVGSLSVLAPTIRILDPATGLPLTSMGRDAITGAGGVLPVPLDTVVATAGWPGNNTGGFSQGQFSLFKVAVDGEGRIYACNLVGPIWGVCFPGPPPNCRPEFLQQGPFRVYRWDTPTSTPRRVYATLDEHSSAIGSFEHSEMPYARIGDSFGVVGKRERVFDPVSQQYILADSARIYVSVENDFSLQNLVDEVLVIQTDTTLNISDGLGRMLPMRLAKRLISPLAGHAGDGVAVVDSSSLSDVWMAKDGAPVVRGRQHAIAGSWPVIDTLTIETQIVTDTVNGAGACGPIKALNSYPTGEKFLVCADGYPSNINDPTMPNVNTRARIMNVTVAGLEYRQTGNTPALGQKTLTANSSVSNYLADVDYKLVPDTAGSKGYRATIFLLMSNNGIGAYRARNVLLPVEFIALRGALNRGSIDLTWDVSREANNYGFDVQRSFFSGAAWESIGFVKGRGTTDMPTTYTFSDPVTEQHESSGIVQYRLLQVDIDGTKNASPTVTVSLQASPGAIELMQNHPNPFNPTTTIEYTLPRASRALLTLVNSLGATVRTIVDADQSAGPHKAILDASELPSGIYSYQLTACGRTVQKKLTLVR